MRAGQEKGNSQSEALHRAAHLRDSIIQRAQERGQSAAQVAGVLNISIKHWYRVKKEPVRLTRVSRATLEAVATYVGWPRVQVLVAVGWLRQSEIDQVISTDGALERAMERLQYGSLANGLTTPLKRASTDHQLLMARLLIIAENEVTARLGHDFVSNRR